MTPYVILYLDSEREKDFQQVQQKTKDVLQIYWSAFSNETQKTANKDWQ